MTDKQFREQKKRITKLIDKWERQLGLRWWTVSHEWAREHKEYSEHTSYEPINVKGNWECAMCVTSDYYYKQATITFFLPVCADLKDAQLEQSFVHELMHIFLNPMKTKQKAKEEELVATMLASAMIWSREAGHHDKVPPKPSTRSRKNLQSGSKPEEDNRTLLPYVTTREGDSPPTLTSKTLTSPITKERREDKLKRKKSKANH
jgi:hypothetical protein